MDMKNHLDQKTKTTRGKKRMLFDLKCEDVVHTRIIKSERYRSGEQRIFLYVLQLIGVEETLHQGNFVSI